MAGTDDKNGDLDFGSELFKAVDELKQNDEPSRNKHILPGPIFLADAFATRWQAMASATSHAMTMPMALQRLHPRPLDASQPSAGGYDRGRSAIQFQAPI